MRPAVNNIPQLPETGFVRLRTILAILPVSRSTFYAWIAAGKVKRPRKLGPKISAWPASEIRDLIASFEGGRDVE
jgi:predicted DNA-binding transcriptional regulator AlpA